MTTPALPPTASPAGAPLDPNPYVARLLELLGAREPLEVMAGTAAVLEGLVARLTDEQLRRPERPGKWSVAQVLAHLADSEMIQGYRVRMAVAHDEPPIQGYDQDLLASRLGYAETPARESLGDFRAMRERNLRLYRRLAPSDLARVGHHAERGPESVQRMLALNAGHDVFHLVQIERIARAVS